MRPAVAGDPAFEERVAAHHEEEHDREEYHGDEDVPSDRVVADVGFGARHDPQRAFEEGEVPVRREVGEKAGSDGQRPAWQEQGTAAVAIEAPSESGNTCLRFLWRVAHARASSHRMRGHTALRAPPGSSSAWPVLGREGAEASVAWQRANGVAGGLGSKESCLFAALGDGSYDRCPHSCVPGSARPDSAQ